MNKQVKAPFSFNVLCFSLLLGISSNVMGMVPITLKIFPKSLYSIDRKVKANPNQEFITPITADDSWVRMSSLAELSMTLKDVVFEEGEDSFYIQLETFYETELQLVPKSKTIWWVRKVISSSSAEKFIISKQEPLKIGDAEVGLSLVAKIEDQLEFILSPNAIFRSICRSTVGDYGVLSVLDQEHNLLASQKFRIKTKHRDKYSEKPRNKMATPSNVSLNNIRPIPVDISELQFASEKAYADLTDEEIRSCLFSSFCEADNNLTASESRLQITDSHVWMCFRKDQIQALCEKYEIQMNDATDCANLIESIVLKELSHTPKTSRVPKQKRKRTRVNSEDLE